MSYDVIFKVYSWKSAKIVRKLKVPLDKILSQKGRGVSKMIKKITILGEKFGIPGSFDEKPSKMC